MSDDSKIHLVDSPDDYDPRRFYEVLRTFAVETQRKYWENTVEPTAIDENGLTLAMAERCRFSIENNETVKTTILMSAATGLDLPDHLTSAGNDVDLEERMRIVEAVHRVMERDGKSASAGTE